MARTPRAPTSVDAIIAREMPQWRIATGEKDHHRGSFEKGPQDLGGSAMPTDSSPSLADLRRKYLREEELSGATDLGGGAEAGFSDLDRGVKTVRIERKDGKGPALTADIDLNGGKVTIVQG